MTASKYRGQLGFTAPITVASQTLAYATGPTLALDVFNRGRSFAFIRFKHLRSEFLAHADAGVFHADTERCHAVQRFCL